MARKKKDADSAENVVVNTTKQEKKDVRHGCLDCVHYDYPVTKQPCKGCERFSAWEDKRLINNEQVK